MNAAAANALRARLQSVAKAQPMLVALVGTQQQRKVVCCGIRAYIMTKVLQLMVIPQHRSRKHFCAWAQNIDGLTVPGNCVCSGLVWRRMISIATIYNVTA